MLNLLERRFTSRLVRFHLGLTVLVILFVCGSPARSRCLAADSTDESIAAYADAANFQTNGAFDLAIESWKDFLKKYPDDEMAPKAAHYLGVCYMQQESPDYVAAAKAFERALKDKSYGLREESLANQGWCWYASAGEEPNRDKSRLKSTLETYEALLREKPKSRFLDRALFYSGEAAYGLGDREKAVGYYNKMLALPSASDSPLKCDALYARGIAYEEMDELAKAIASFDQLIKGCANADLITDVHLRMGDVRIFRKDYSGAVNSFDQAIKTAESDEDKSYAISRQAFALVQAGKPGEAAKKYDLLREKFPESKYAATAMLAGAQSLYRSGEMDKAAERFNAVRGQDNVIAATEAAHWLCRIYIAKGRADQAVKIAKDQISKGVKGDYATELKLDLAESLALNPNTVADSISIAEAVYHEAGNGDLAPRALYNAAFSALQVNQHKKALELAEEFAQKFPRHNLRPDIQFIIAESQLLSGKLGLAAESYERLLSEPSANDNQQRPLWILRAATTSNAAKKYDETVELLRREYRSLSLPSHKAEAQILIGQAYMMTKRHNDAATAFRKSREVDPKWARADEATLLAGAALFADGKQEEAQSVWQNLIRRNENPRMVAQAQYKLAQMASNQSKHDDAVRLYDKILDSEADKGLIPYCLYGKGWALMQNDKYQQAVKPLNQAIRGFRAHSIGDDALLARGITLRHLEDYTDASVDLEEYLTTRPTGTNLGHALYELALIDQKQKKPDRAASRLRQLVKDVPKYPDMDKVLYELGWSLKESGQDREAEKYFAELVKRYPKTGVAGEAAYFIGQKKYSAGDWKEAAKQFAVATQTATDKKLSEKAHYRLGWSYYKVNNFRAAEKAFQLQATKHSDGGLAMDALMMVGECRFKERRYAEALQAYGDARKRIQANNENSKSLRDPAERQVRELIMLHGGQSAAQSKQWDSAIEWYDELKERFPNTKYLPQVFYETGFAYQQKEDADRALKYYSEVADKYRNEVAARSRFMMGEIHFGRKQFDKAIPEFQRVMFGFGAEKAPAAIKNWQAKSGYEAARCSELLMQSAKSADGRKKSRDFAAKFYDYVIQNHAGHELAKNARDRLEKLK